MDEEEGIYRGEVEVILFALADIRTDLQRVLSILEGYDEDDDEEEEEEDTDL